MQATTGTYGTVTLEQAQRTLDRMADDVVAYDNIMHDYADSGQQIPRYITSEYKDLLRRAIRYAEVWGLDHSLDC